MKRLIREPLLHFLVLGALLFGLYGWLNREGFKAPNEIVVSRGQVVNLSAQFERISHRGPTQQELEGLIDNWVREEILYREGLAMNLDRDDPVVRRRIQQKVEFIVDSAAPEALTSEELQRWLDEHADSYRIEPSYVLRQVYFEPARHGERLEHDIATARQALDSGKSHEADATMLPAAMKGAAAEIARTFGNDFEDALRTLPVGGWRGPIKSGFGLHLVELTQRQEGRRASLAEVRTDVERDLLHARAQQANAAFYEKLRANYTVRIEAGNVLAAAPAG